MKIANRKTAHIFAEINQINFLKQYREKEGKFLMYKVQIE